MSVTGPTLPFLQEQVGSSISQVSYIFTARSIGVLSGSFMGKSSNYFKNIPTPILAKIFYNIYMIKIF